MLKALSTMLVATSLCMPSLARAETYKSQHHGSYGSSGQHIIVSCFRGPWKEVIWDRPNPVFIDSLVAVGYDYPTAQAISQRVCRDPALVGNPAALKSTMRRIWRDGRN